MQVSQSSMVRQVRIAGDLTKPVLLEAFIARTQDEIAAAPAQLIVDLESVDAADTKAVAVLVLIFAAADRQRVELELRVSDVVRRWLVLCRVDFLVRVSRPTESDLSTSTDPVEVGRDPSIRADVRNSRVDGKYRRRTRARVDVPVRGGFTCLRRKSLASEARGPTIGDEPFGSVPNSFVRLVIANGGAR